MFARKEIEPGQEYAVDLFRPEDAEGVARLFREVYGEGYPVRTYLEPEKLIAKNAAGRTISSVVRTIKGDIVGHNALYPISPCEKVYESGAGLVHPLYQGGKGLFIDMIRHGIEVGAQTIGLEGVFGEAVCNHPFAQKAILRCGFKVTGLEVDLMPAEAYSKTDNPNSRVSSFVSFVPITHEPHLVRLPPAYESQLLELYGVLSEPRRMKTGNDSYPADSVTRLKQTVYDFARVARITVESAGPDFPEKILETEAALNVREVIVIQLWLKLEWPWIGSVVEALRSQGYFLGGILPRWFDRDGLLMQKINAAPNWDGIQVASDSNRRILDMIQADWKAVTV